MKRVGLALPLIAIFVCLPLASLPPLQAQSQHPLISTDKSIYPIWGVGGVVNVTLSGLESNSTYFLWLQRPFHPASNLTNILIIPRVPHQVVQLALSSNRTSDPAGTYLLSLSTSNVVDTRVAAVHFGTFGVDKDVYQRTESVLALGGGVYPNSTVSLTLRYQAGPSSKESVNASSRGVFQYYFGIPADAPIGGISISASGITIDTKQTVSVSVQASDIVASIQFQGQIPGSVQRASIVLFNFTLAYPNGTLLDPHLLVSYPNVTITEVGPTGLEAETFLLNYSLDTGYWSHLFAISANATLGTYSYSMTTKDLFGNPGSLNGTFEVDRAKLIIVVSPLPTKANPGQIIDVAIYVWYPNMTTVTDTVANVTALITDTHGNNVTLPMNYNATDARWHVFYEVPSLGFHFGIVLTFSFTATDLYQNSGTASDAYVLTAGASPQEVILAGIAGTIIPIALLTWALVTVSKKRRQHKP